MHVMVVTMLLTRVRRGLLLVVIHLCGAHVQTGVSKVVELPFALSVWVIASAPLPTLVLITVLLLLVSHLHVRTAHHVLIGVKC